MALCFDLTPEQNILRQSVREFAEKEIRPVARELDAREEFSCNLTRKMGEMGLFGVFVSPDYGGSGLDYVSYILAVEEIARVDGSHAATVAAGNSLGIGPIYYFGREDQKQTWLPELCTGQKLAGFGLTEPLAGSDAGASRTRASLDGDQWVINGSKIFITNAATEMTERMKTGVAQANGSIAVEPRMNVAHVGSAVLYMANLPLDANVQFITIMATKMPFVGRG